MDNSSTSGILVRNRSCQSTESNCAQAPSKEFVRASWRPAWRSRCSAFPWIALGTAICLLTCNTTAVTGLQQRNPCVSPAGLRQDVLRSISWLGARETMSPQPSREIFAFVDGPHPENCPQRPPPIANCAGASMVPSWNARLGAPVKLPANQSNTGVLSSCPAADQIRGTFNGDHR